MSKNPPPAQPHRRPESDPQANKAAMAAGTQAPYEQEDEEEVEESGHKFLLFNVVPSWMVSFVAHIALIILLALWFIPIPKERTVALEAGEQSSEQIDDFAIDLTEMDFETEVLEEELTEPEQAMELETEPPQVELEEIVDFGSMFVEEAIESESLELNASDMVNETSGRTGTGAEEALRQYGGNQASEDAVSLALKWIAAHQLEDGSWNFDHQRGDGNHRTSPNPGSMVDARMGATAIALLPFLGKGQTHLNGEYKEQIAAGLRYLMENARKRGRGFSYRDQGTMYSHGIVAIVFCEAYAMTRDPALQPFAQGTVYFIEDAQDPVGGGWRYQEGQAGDTSAVGWQIMGLKSGKMCGLQIRNGTYRLAKKFLDDVSTNYGAYYGYTNPPAPGERGHKARNAVGLLCRMYMGWDKSNPGLEEGMSYLSELGPDTSVGDGINMYYNYYATQAMKHYGGDDWTRWNEEMRDFLIKSQSKAGPTEGSWYFSENHSASSGGRLYVTAMACMTLEVYYRYLPLYSEDAANEEFKLD